MLGRDNARLDLPPDAEEAVGIPFTVSVTHPTDGRVIVRAVGEIDLLTASHWAAALEEATDRAASDGPAPSRGPDSEWPPEVLCDLGAITFFGAAGVSVLLTAAARAQAMGVVLVVTAPSRLTRRVLAVAGVDDMLTIRSALSAEQFPPSRPLAP